MVTDDEVFEIAWGKERILITNDSDFGEKVYRDHHPHHGVIFMRLENERSQNKIIVLANLLEKYADKLPNQFVVVTENAVRFGKRPSSKTADKDE